MFGLLANRWRVFHATIHLSLERATSVTLKYHVLKSPSKSTYCTPVFIDQEDEQGNVITGSWHSEHMIDKFRSITPQSHGNNISNSSKNILEVFMDYFMKKGAVIW